MSFASDNGYTPATFNELMELARVGVNETFSTSFTSESFVGTNYYKFYYVIIQELLKNEAKTSEIFAKLQNYISSTNERIQRPSVSLPGIIDSMASRGYVAAVKKMVEADAGTISIAVDVDNADPDYAATRLEICELILDFVVAGVVTLGTEIETLTLSNGQQFDFKFFLPDETPIRLRLSLSQSDNTTLTVPDDEIIRTTLFDAIGARYRLGWNFEPQRYFTQSDAPWAESILLEWSDDAGSSWHDEVFVADFRDKLTFDLSDIDVQVF